MHSINGAKAEMCRARGSWQGIFWVLLQTKRLHDQLFAWQMDRLQELTVFVRAAESGSFSRAARTRTFAAIGLTHHWRARAATRRDLFLRATRRITVTDARGRNQVRQARDCLITRWSRWRFTPSFQ